MNALTDSCPWILRCTGVIVMIATIVICDSAIAAMASREEDECRSGMSTSESERLGPASDPNRPAIASGSGLSLNHTFRSENVKKRPEKIQGPVYRFHPNRDSPNRSAGLIKIGPKTAPNVEAKSTLLMAFPRCSGSARSVAAYRARRFDACPLPNKNSPTMKIERRDVSTPTPAIIPPMSASPYPIARPGRRPRELITRASTCAMNAVPTVTVAVAIPPSGVS